jgi:hypothetical protein
MPGAAMRDRSVIDRSPAAVRGSENTSRCNGLRYRRQEKRHFEIGCSGGGGGQLKGHLGRRTLRVQYELGIAMHFLLVDQPGRIVTWLLVQLLSNQARKQRQELGPWIGMPIDFTGAESGLTPEKSVGCDYGAV